MKLRIRSVLVFSTLGLAHTAYAQSDPMAEAEAAFNDAEAYYNLGDWANALEYYKKSFLLSKSPTLLFNLGQCQRQLGQYKDAQRSYKNFLRQTNLPLGDPYRVQAESLLLLVEAKIAESKSQPTTIKTSEPQPATQPTEEKPKSLTFRAIPLWGAGGVALGVGVFAGVIARESASELEGLHQNPDASQAEFDEISARARRQALVCDVAFLAAVGAGVGGFFVFQKAKKQAETSVQLTPSSVTLLVRF